MNLSLSPLIPQAKAQLDYSLPSPVTPVRELRDVQPTDWAFSALQQLQQQYQCIQGYQDQTFRGEQPITRYEFAALLNRCLNQFQENLRAEESSTIQRLQNEFARELSILRGRVDAATARVRELEITQFSTSTKLRGNVNFVVTNSSQSGEETGIVFQARSRLNFETSFTGRDRLLTRFTAGNSPTPNLADNTAELTQTHQRRGNTDNDIILGKLSYQFPIGEKTVAMLTPEGGLHADYNAPAVNPFFEDFNGGTTTVSTYAQRNPILSLGGGTGVAFSHQLNPTLQLGAGYYTPQAGNPEQGLFNGSYSTGVRLKWDANKNLSFGLNYLHSYFEQGDFGFKEGLSDPSVGTAVVNDILTEDFAITNAYGIEVFWRVNPKLGLGGRFGYTDLKTSNSQNGEIWNYAVSVVFPELGSSSNLGGLIIGAQPYLGSLEGETQFSNHIPWHLEGFYQWQISDNVSLTPSLIWHPNPNQDKSEADILTSTMRMTVTF